MSDHLCPMCKERPRTRNTSGDMRATCGRQQCISRCRSRGAQHANAVRWGRVTVEPRPCLPELPALRWDNDGRLIG